MIFFMIEERGRLKKLKSDKNYAKDITIPALAAIIIIDTIICIDRYYNFKRINFLWLKWVGVLI